ncbi:Gfo/Idh/MocA family protein [Paenibacillus sp. N3.4]|uniref:Gfo/Idh/MocA family protein n=1 Tax=Paenibacillus sp. N3.4 TaxID=2603222 RepID=UPI0016509D2E|nr:Gfo/Idh/MocA family oxidoreductase [Paenibacillus sp. N3.4]
MMPINNTPMIRGAVVGYSRAFKMGQLHGEQMNQAGLEFAAVCEIDEACLNQAKIDFPNIRTFQTIEELLAQPDINLITIITPHHTHAELAMKVLESGKHCILEKPMCIDTDDAEALVRKAKEKGVMLSVYHNRRWDGWYLTLQDLIQKDLLGELFSVEMSIGGHGHPGYWWRSDKVVSGGAFYDWGAHYIDWLLGIVPGKMKSIRGFVQKRLWHDVTNEDHMESTIVFEGGAVANVQVSSIARAGKANRRILGTKGAVISNHNENYLMLYTELNGLKVESKVPLMKDEWHNYYQNIADHLLKGAELIVKPEEARRIIAVLDTTAKSAAADRELPVPYE